MASHRVTAGDIEENAKHATGKKAAKTYTRIAFIVNNIEEKRVMLWLCQKKDPKKDTTCISFFLALLLAC